MAKKRQTVTDKWGDPWFMNLSPQSKLLWLYLLDNCDYVGIYEYNEVLLRVQIGFTDKVDVKKHFSDLGDKIEWFEGSKKLWVKNFIRVQYGELEREASEKVSSIHVTVLRELGRYVGKKGLPPSFIQKISTLQEKISRVQVGYTYPIKNKNKNKEIIGMEKIQKVFEETVSDQKWIEATCMGKNLKQKDLVQWLQQYNSSISQDAIEGFDTSTYKKMFGGWLNVQLGKGYKLTDVIKPDGLPSRFKVLS
jgi:hypothetical protein